MSSEESKTLEGDVEADILISRVALKLPPLWKSLIKLSFFQVENSFDIAGITSDNTKYKHVFSIIDQYTLSTISDIIFNPPVTNKYKTLKSRLIPEYSDTEGTQIQKLLNEISLGDDRPTHMLRRMRELASDYVSEKFLKNI